MRLHLAGFSRVERWARFVEFSGSRKLLLPLLAGWCLFVCLYGISAGPLYRTEALRAVVARCCWQEGCWLYPVLYGEPFLTKPPGHYLAIVLSSLPWGEVTTSSARLPSVVGALVALGALFGLLRRSVGERMAAATTAVAPLSLLWLDKVPSAEIDMSLTGWLTLALASWYRAQVGEAGVLAPRWRCSWLMVAALALVAATLTKWTAPAFFILTVSSFALLSGRRRAWRHWKPWAALLLAGGLVLLWVAAVVHQVGFEVFRDTLQREAIYRLLPSVNKTDGWLAQPSFPLRVLGALFPISLPALSVLHPHYYRRIPLPARSLVLFFHCWTWPNLLFWTCVPNHNVRYVLPIAPAVAGLGAFGGYLILQDLRQRFPRLRPWLALTFPTVLLFGLVVKLIFVEFVTPMRAARRNPLPIAKQLRRLVPEHETLYIDKMKDDGVMFYFGQQVRRWRGSPPLPAGAYLALIAAEWEQWRQRDDVELLGELQDQQGDPLIVVRWRFGMEKGSGG